MIAYNRDIAATVRRSFRSRQAYFLMVFLLCVCLGVSASPHALADTLPQRSLTIANITPGATTTHSFAFSFGSPTAIGSITLDYCTNPLPEITCDTPTGLDVSQSILDNQAGETGFTLNDRQAGHLLLSRTSTPATAASTYVFSNITNPTGSVGTFYVRITTFASDDATGPETDFGAVVNSTADGVSIDTEVPPILKFCVGLTLATDCTTADDSLIDLGDLVPARASKGSSQMIAATNAQFGLAIAAYGTTMTSGNNVIAALAVPTLSAPGNAQFGMNLRKNTDPAVGEEPSGIGISQPTTTYNIANRYMFKSGDVVATSPDATDVRKFTSSYIVNVPPSQVPGVYTATLTYICTATF
jgi:hypothetical protein